MKGMWAVAKRGRCAKHALFVRSGGRAVASVSKKRVAIHGAAFEAGNVVATEARRAEGRSGRGRLLTSHG